VQMEGNVERIVRWVEEWKKVREGLEEDEEMDVVPFAADAGDQIEEAVGDEDEDEDEDDEEEEDDGKDAKA